MSAEHEWGRDEVSMNWVQRDSIRRRPKNLESVYGFNPKPRKESWKPSRKPITNNDASELADAYKGVERERGMSG